MTITFSDRFYPYTVDATTTRNATATTVIVPMKQETIQSFMARQKIRARPEPSWRDVRARNVKHGRLR